jgi:SPFH domain / Band 7 family
MKKKKQHWPEVITPDKGESMPSSKLTAAVGALVAVFALIAAGVVYANINYTQEGTVKVVTYFGRIEKVYRPEDGWFTTLAPGREAYEVNIKSFTEKTPVRVTSRDNAALQVEISVTAYTDGRHVEDYVRKYGFDEATRHARRNEILHGLIQTEARNAFSEHAAYEIYANQEGIQKRIVETLRPLLAGQLQQTLESVQIGNPDFLDDRIEAAASGVVANEKQKQAEEARLEAAKIAAQTKQIEALTYANPALLDIKRLEMQLEIERARAEGIRSHQGPLTIMYGTGAGVQVQVPAGR